MASTKSVVEMAVGAALFFILIGGVIWSGYSQAQGTYEYESVNSTSEWDNAINTSASQFYDVSDDNLTLTNSSSYAATQRVYADDHDTLKVEAEHITGDLTIELRNDSGDTLESTTTSGQSSVELTHDNYTEGNYYLWWNGTSAGSAEVDYYTVTGESSRSSAVESSLLIAMLLFVIGVALSFR